jgi:hypothetical protein
MRLELKFALNPEVKIGIGASHSVDLFLLAIRDGRYECPFLHDWHRFFLETIHFEIIEFDEGLKSFKAEQFIPAMDDLGDEILMVGLVNRSDSELKSMVSLCLDSSYLILN